MPRPQLVLPSLLGLALCASLPAARADSAQVTVLWNAPDDCPDDAALVAKVETLLGQSLSAPRAQDLAARVSVQGRRADGYSAKVVFDTSRGLQERYLEHPDCTKLADATALLVALAIDPERVASQQQARSEVVEPAPTTPPPSESIPSATGSAEPPSTAPPASEPAPPRAASPPLSVVVRLAGVVATGILPRSAVGVDAELGLRRGRFQAQLLGRYWLPRVTSIPEAPAAGIELSLATLGARACGAPLLDEWSLWACAGVDVGSMTGQGIVIDGARSRSDRFSSLAAGLHVAYAHSRPAPFAGLELGYLLQRPQFGILLNERFESTFRPSAWSLGGVLGLELDL